jgi:hypothetical protein
MDHDEDEEGNAEFRALPQLSAEEMREKYPNTYRAILIVGNAFEQLSTMPCNCKNPECTTEYHRKACDSVGEEALQEIARKALVQAMKLGLLRLAEHMRNEAKNKAKDTLMEDKEATPDVMRFTNDFLERISKSQS